MAIDDFGRMIYVVTTDEGFPCKVGTTGDLSTRLSQLSCGNWVPLKAAWYSFVVSAGSDAKLNMWSAFRTMPSKLEFAVHRKMKELDLHLSGEWFAVDVEDCVSVIRKVAEEQALRLSGIEMLQSIALHRTMNAVQVEFLQSFIDAEKSARVAMQMGEALNAGVA